MSKKQMDFLREAVKQLPINKFSLDKECEQNGSLYRYWSDVLADLKYKRDLLKVELKEKEAEVNLNARKGMIPKEFEGVKLTESVYTSIIQIDSEIKDISRKLIESEKNVNKMEAVVKAFGQRKGLLDNLVTLFISNYFSEPNTKRRKSVDDEFTDKINNNLKQRRGNNGSKQTE